MTDVLPYSLVTQAAETPGAAEITEHDRRAYKSAILYIRRLVEYNLTMVKRIFVYPLILPVLLTIAPNVRAAASFYLGVPFVTDESRDLWDEGAMLGIQQHHPISNHLQLGGQFGIYRFIGSGNRLLFVVEAYPSIRITNVLPELGGLDLSIQAGLGATFVHGDGSPSHTTPDCAGCSSVDSNGPDNMGDLWAFGFNAGIGVTLFKLDDVMIEFVPMYHYAYPGDDRNGFMSFGLVFFGGTGG